MNQKKRLSVKTVVLIGMFGALAAVLETFQIPVPFAAARFISWILPRLRS